MMTRHHHNRAAEIEREDSTRSMAPRARAAEKQWLEAHHLDKGLHRIKPRKRRAVNGTHVSDMAAPAASPLRPQIWAAVGGGFRIEIDGLLIATCWSWEAAKRIRDGLDRDTLERIAAIGQQLKKTA